MNKTTVSSNESDLVITEEQPMMKDNQAAENLRSEIEDILKD